MPTKNLEHYIIGKTIGKGAEGVCKLALEKSSHERFVVKVFNQDDDFDEHPTRRLSCHHSHTHLAIPHELCIIRLLVDEVHRHPHIIELHDVVHEHGNWYEVLEYCSRGDLVRSMHAANGALPEFHCQKIFRQIIEGLEYMHNRGICHRDMKLENCLLDGFGSLKIADFGKSVIFIDDEGNRIPFHEPVGTLAYMAPEVFYSHQYFGDEIDIWSVGALLLFLLCGDIMWEKPHAEDADFSWFVDGHLLASYTFSETLKDLLTKMLSLDPSDRITLKGIKEHEWFANRSDRGVHTCLSARPSIVTRLCLNSSRRNIAKVFSDLWKKIRLSHKSKEKRRSAEQKAIKMLLMNCPRCLNYGEESSKSSEKKPSPVASSVSSLARRCSYLFHRNPSPQAVLKA
eukprot:Sdes_comp15146_c0_seq1m3959